MTMRRLLFLALAVFATPARAMDFSYDASVDFRLVAPGDERSWLDGGLGKLRYGEGDSSAQFGGAIVQGYALLTPEIMAVGVLQADPEQKDSVLPLEAYVRYRPVSTSPWRWSTKFGAFFPPFSLENSQLGWTSCWTITPSAINSWIGDELRTIGDEGKLEWRRPAGTLSFTGALYGWNEPAGVLMAVRGWAMDDEPTALFEDPRRPGDTLKTTPMFEQFDGRAGWYSGGTWEDSDQWRAEIFRYDNNADPAAHRDGNFAWHTDFWDGGISKTCNEFTLLAQGMTGATSVEPRADYISLTHFSSAYALLGWERGDWRLAARVDDFRTHTDPGSARSEDGYALTGSVSWLPKEWLRLSTEILYIDSKRKERSAFGLDPEQGETQAQLMARFYL
jgi:hypothetical protein